MKKLVKLEAYFSKQSPMVAKYFHTLMHTVEERFFLRQLCGYCMTETGTDRTMYVIHGQGKGGKSSLITLLQKILTKGLLCQANASILASDKKRQAGGPAADLVELRGKRVAILSESNKGQRIDSQNFKRLVSGGKDAINCQGSMRKPPSRFTFEGPSFMPLNITPLRWMQPMMRFVIGFASCSFALGLCQNLTCSKTLVFVIS